MMGTTKTIKTGLSKNTAKVISGLVAKPIKNALPYFKLIGLRIDQATQRTFKFEGSRDGRTGWKSFNNGQGVSAKGGTTRNKKGTWNHRYGTDNSKNRRYSASSKLLQASGSFRKSFQIIKATKKSLAYGIRGLKMRKLGLKIMSSPERQVLFVTKNDKTSWTNEFVKYYNKRF